VSRRGKKRGNLPPEKDPNIRGKGHRAVSPVTRKSLQTGRLVIGEKRDFKPAEGGGDRHLLGGGNALSALTRGETYWKSII